MRIPSDIEYILRKLAENGFEAYLVGGCVRDFLLGQSPSDFDITTNALPEEIMRVFSSERVIPTGIKHGTVTVMHGNASSEITTYRTDGAYTDGRHPDSVKFSGALCDDLCRRDFTVNAMAMDIDRSIIDLYGGKEDLEKRVIRTVGMPNDRFNEDGLRILRAFRFASKLGFTVESETLAAAYSVAPRLALVSRERIFTEIEKLLLGKSASYAVKLMLDGGVFDCIFEHPEVNVSAISYIERLPLSAEVRFAALFLYDKHADAHIGSLKTSALFAKEVMAIIGSKVSNDIALPDLRREVCAFGMSAVVARAEILKLESGKSRAYDLTVKMRDEENCFSVRDLKINGEDVVLHTPFRGKEIGNALLKVLLAVFDGEIDNEYTAEINFICAIRQNELTNF